MNGQKQVSSSLKVGFLTITALAILIFTILWIKGRSLSSGERIEVAFKDINGIRAGSQVQMMGLRIGQIEDIIPVIDGIESYVKVRFVVTEKGVKIPPVSTISIQQSGLIGEQFLEVTPPKPKTIYVETSKATTVIAKDDIIYMSFFEQLRPIGKIIKSEVVNRHEVPIPLKENINTKNALKLQYILDVPGLILDNDNLDARFESGKLVFFIRDGNPPLWPHTDSPYTVIEPMRIADFMDLQFKAAKALDETNHKIAQILSDEVVIEIQSGIKNINELTQKASTTFDKASALIDSSKEDLDIIIKQTDKLVGKLVIIADNVNALIGDKNLKENVMSASKSFTRLSNNLNKVLEDPQTKEMLTNVEEISRNLADISSYANEFTKDENLKKDLTKTISNLNTLTGNLNETLYQMHEIEDGQKVKLQDAISDTLVITRNLKEFSKKLNKRFLLFRLMF